MARQEQPKKKQLKKELVPKEITLSYEEKAYLKLLFGHPLSWSTVYCPMIDKMLNKKILILDTNKMVGLSKLGKQLYASTIEDKD
jgi:hypothetical protein